MTDKSIETPKRIMIYIFRFILVGIIAIIVGIFLGFIIAGGNPFSMFDPQTWQHIFDFLK